MEDFLRYFMYDFANDSYIQAFLKIKKFIEKSAEKNKAFCRILFENKELLEKLWRDPI
uniref:RGS domain-containing protein n=1 Tax=Anguilla anguilla TaxID=7936 RepID=A0A0E9Q5V8_ANGAN